MDEEKVEKLFVFKTDQYLSEEQIKVVRKQLEYFLPKNDARVRFLVLDKTFDLTVYEL